MIILFYPETKGKTLEEMDQLFNPDSARQSTDSERDGQPIKIADEDVGQVAVDASGKL